MLIFDTLEQLQQEHPHLFFKFVHGGGLMKGLETFQNKGGAGLEECAFATPCALLSAMSKMDPKRFHLFVGMCLYDLIEMSVSHPERFLRVVHGDSAVPMLIRFQYENGVGGDGYSFLEPLALLTRIRGIDHRIFDEYVRVGAFQKDMWESGRE
jgi:hypothetical protein